MNRAAWYRSVTLSRHSSHETAKLIDAEVCYRNTCGWDTGVGYIQSIRKGNQTTYFCINYPSRALDRFMASIKTNPSIAYRDFYLDILAAEDTCKQWRFHDWSTPQSASHPRVSV